jgi:hypothetical protein
MSNKRYIDAEALVNKIFPYGMLDGGNYPIQAKAVRKAIDGIEAADVVEVVRCKDCKIGSPDAILDGFYYCHNNNLLHKGDHYCSYGTRKEGGSNG